jgi:hypothetical protein
MTNIYTSISPFPPKVPRWYCVRINPKPPFSFQEFLRRVKTSERDTLFKILKKKVVAAAHDIIMAETS